MPLELNLDSTMFGRRSSIIEYVYLSRNSNRMKGAITLLGNVNACTRV